MSFDFCGNENMVSLLNNIVEHRRFSHAYLFYGEEGVGKKTIARQFAQAILCKNQNKPCMECDSCKKFLTKNHPDYFEIGMDSSKGKQGFSVSDARKLIEDAYIKPNEGSYKIFLLNNVDTLLGASANTLLKTLEEPPKHVIFLLISGSRSGILETISSRCVPVGVYPVESEICFNEIKNRFADENEKQLQLVSQLCEGSIGRAIFYLDTSMGREALSISEKLLQAYFDNNELRFLQAVAPLEDSLELSLEVFKCFLSRVRVFMTQRIKDENNLNVGLLNNVDKVVECVEHSKKILISNGNKKLTICRLCAEVFQK